MVNNLKKLRNERKITLQELSERVDLATSTLSRLELGNQNLHIDQAIILADFFECSIDELVDRQFIIPERTVVKTVDFDYNDILHKIKAYSRNDLQRLKGVIDFLLETRENGHIEQRSENAIHKN